MKHWMWYAGLFLLAAIFGLLPFSGSDVAQLKPVEVICVQKSDSEITVTADTLDYGQADTLEKAFYSLKANASGNIFLETVDYLLINEEAKPIVKELTGYLRPACKVCAVEGTVDMEQVVAYLNSHEPNVTLGKYTEQGGILQRLVVRKGRMELVS